MSVEELGAYLSKNGENIREQLRTRKCKPQPVRRVEIPFAHIHLETLENSKEPDESGCAQMSSVQNRIL